MKYTLLYKFLLFLILILIPGVIRVHGHVGDYNYRRRWLRHLAVSSGDCQLTGVGRHGLHLPRFKKNVSSDIMYTQEHYYWQTYIIRTTKRIRFFYVIIFSFQTIWVEFYALIFSCSMIL